MNKIEQISRALCVCDGINSDGKFKSTDDGETAHQGSKEARRVLEASSNG